MVKQIKDEDSKLGAKKEYDLEVVNAAIGSLVNAFILDHSSIEVNKVRFALVLWDGEELAVGHNCCLQHTKEALTGALDNLPPTADEDSARVH